MRALTPRTFLITAALALALAGSAWAQGNQNLRVSLLGGVGGSLDEDQAGYSNPAFQLGLEMELSHLRNLALRVGRISYDDNDFLGPFGDPSVDYVTIGGEYLFDEEFYTSGMFVGLGYYRLEGVVSGSRDEDSAVGLNVGANGLFDINRRVSLMAEVSFHLLDSDIAQVLAVAMGGVAVHF